MSKCQDDLWTLILVALSWLSFETKSKPTSWIDFDMDHLLLSHDNIEHCCTRSEFTNRQGQINKHQLDTIKNMNYLPVLPATNTANYRLEIQTTILGVKMRTNYFHDFAMAMMQKMLGDIEDCNTYVDDMIVFVKRLNTCKEKERWQVGSNACHACPTNTEQNSVWNNNFWQYILGNYANEKEFRAEDVLPFAFPYDIGGPKMMWRVKVSVKECIKRYMRTEMPQLMRKEDTLVLQHIFGRQVSYSSEVTQCHRKKVWTGICKWLWIPIWWYISGKAINMFVSTSMAEMAEYYHTDTVHPNGQSIVVVDGADGLISWC